MLLWVLLVAAAIAGLLVRELWILFALPAAARLAVVRGEPEIARRLLERVIGSWSLFGERARGDARYRLAWLYVSEGRSAEAAEQCRLMLRPRLPPGVEAAVRQRLADALEAAGDAEAAGTERQRAADLVSHSTDVDACLSRGRLLAEQGRFAEACDAFEAALVRLPHWNSIARSETLVRLALSAFQAGRPEEAVRRAEEVLALDLPEGVATEAHGVASLAYAALGRFEEAERFGRAAEERARASGNQDRAARALLQLAGIQFHQGRLTEAMRMCAEAAAMSLAARRTARATESECLRAWGRYDEALTVLQQAEQAPGVPVPSAERRARATLAIGRAWIWCEAGDGPAALAALDEAAAELARDEKLALWLDVTRAWALALASRHTEAAAEVTRLETLAKAATDRTTALTGLSYLARAAFTLDDFSRAEALWQDYLTRSPSPVMLPLAWFSLGECHRSRHDLAGAVAAYHHAVATGIDTVFTRRAMGRLTELGWPSPQPPLHNHALEARDDHAAGSKPPE